MKTFLKIVVVFVTFSLSVDAAITITSRNGDETTSRTFHDDMLFSTTNNRLDMLVDLKQDICKFTDNTRLVTGKCEDMFRAMKDMQQQLMSGMSEQERAMFQSMRGSRAGGKPAEIAKSGTRTIANYETQCYVINDKRDVCFSRQLASDIGKEIDWDKMVEKYNSFADSMNLSGFSDPVQDAIRNLSKNAYLMLDMQEVSTIPGLDPNMMRFIPEEQRAMLMKQGGSPGSTKKTGEQVVAVKKAANPPKLPDLSGFETVDFDAFMQENLRQMGSTPGMR